MTDYIVQGRRRKNIGLLGDKWEDWVAASDLAIAKEYIVARSSSVCAEHEYRVVKRQEEVVWQEGQP
jgi:hypothetical protein